MPFLKHAALATAYSLLIALPASADEYSVTVDGPLLGSIIPRTKVSLGIQVNIDKTWDELPEDEKMLWRQFTELLDPRVTPPFPTPNIRSFLKKLNTPERFRTTDRILREEELMLVVRVSADGSVGQVEVISGTEKGASKLTETETVIAHVYVRALLNTKFTPAKLDGTAAPSAFPMRIHQVTHMQ